MARHACIPLVALALRPAAAQVPVPAPVQHRSILLYGATAHCGDGRVIEQSAIGFRDGKLDLVADARVIKLRSGAFDTIIDVTGKQVYPGLIALNTTVGLSELELVRATRDFRETGALNPSVRALIAYNTDSKIIPTLRVNGVLLAEVVPEGGLISGLS
jgi:imidazolonepropionase-like amidohydrolase